MPLVVGCLQSASTRFWKQLTIVDKAEKLDDPVRATR